MLYKYLMKTVYDHNCIRVIDHALSAETCQQLRENFELCHRHHSHRSSTHVTLTELELYSTRARGRSLGSLQLAQKTRPYDWTEDSDRLTDLVINLGRDYLAHWGHEQGLALTPNVMAIEAFRIKCYRPNDQDQFGLHVDVAHAASSTRYVAFLFYLNDSDAGTEFPRERYTVAAREGRVVIFPPTWCYPHRGMMPQDGGTKYIMSSYLLYT